MVKDYNSKMAIGVGDDSVRFVSMGCIYSSINENNHLLTYGLGPCVGVSIVIKCGNNDVIRLLAHMDIGQVIGCSFDYLNHTIQRLQSNIAYPIKQINIFLVTTQSYKNMHNLTENETKLLAMILAEFQRFGITINDINFVYSSQVQISPNGEHRKSMLMSDLQSFGGYIHPELNIYITNYGAYMCNCSLDVNSTDEEIKSELSESYYQKYIADGYELVIAPSFNNPDCLAVYVTNWDDINYKYGSVPGCLRVESKETSSLKKGKKQKDGVL